MQPTSAKVATLRHHQDSPNENFLDITKRTKKKKGEGTGYEMEKTTKEDLRDHVILVLVFSFSNSYLLKTK